MAVGGGIARLALMLQRLSNSSTSAMRLPSTLSMMQRRCTRKGGKQKKAHIASNHILYLMFAMFEMVAMSERMLLHPLVTPSISHSGGVDTRMWIIEVSY